MKKNIPMQHRVKDLLMIVLAVLLYSLGVSLFYGPSGLTPGGLSGLAI
ncbi:MAG: YitT family protein, partial [Clostridia bacterium]|nr:YitT family protein [Clostridia bacterium]